MGYLIGLLFISYLGSNNLSKEDTIIGLIFLVIGLFFLFLLTKKWAWQIILFFGGLASLFTTIASIIYFQILGAIGFFILMCIFWGILAIVNDIE